MSGAEPDFVRRARTYLSGTTTRDPLEPNQTDTKRDVGAADPDPKPKLFALGRALKHPLADYGFLLGICALLLVIGLVMVLSASTVLSLSKQGSSYALFIRQGIFALMGVGVLVFLSRMPVVFFRRLSSLALAVAGLMLVATLVPGIGTKVNGQTNWLSLGGPFQLQPSEFAKYALILWIAMVLSNRSDRVDNWRTLLLPIAPVSGVFLFLILAEGDLGTCLVIMPIITGMLLVAGAPKKLFGWIGISAVAVVALMSIAAPYRLARFTT
ncbi:MAG: FtsW/RodA/SpoVE family cell cycle protein, partial [Actinomycetes bacterium]